MDYPRFASVALSIAVAVSLSINSLGQEDDRSTARTEIDLGRDALVLDEPTFEGRTAAQWISDWDANKFESNQKAIDALVALGPAAVGPLTKLIEERHTHSHHAIQTLAKMGEQARPVLPALLQLASDKSSANPEGWNSNVSLRELLLGQLQSFGWAADAWVPVLETVANDADETERARLQAVHALGGMGPAGEPTLNTLATSENAEIRAAANEALVTAAVATGKSREETYREIIERNPFDLNVPTYLVRMQGRYNNGKPNPTTQKVKALIRERLAAEPDAELAFALATIIRNGLANTDLEFAAPTDGYRSQYDREDPAENYSTLAAALELVLAHAPRDSDLAARAGSSLARLRLLQGDWDGMNAALEQIGRPTIPAELRPILPAPPFDWTNLRQDWQPSDESLRNGSAAIEFEFQKDGRPLAGAHVLIKRRPPPQTGWRTGFRADTLLYATQPLEVEPYDAFGYRAADRAMTRYAVSDATGKVRIERLPPIPIVVEVLIPTSNFTEPAQNWDLLMELSPGQFHPTWMQPRSGGRGRQNGERDERRADRPAELASVDRREGPAVVELKEGETLQYPKFVVRPQLSLNIGEWSPVDPETFVLRWQPLNYNALAIDHYVVEMMLTAPSQTSFDVGSQRVIRGTSDEAIDTQWPAGRVGVGGQRLRPGNIYMFEVHAVDGRGELVARLPRTRVWVPWTHRESEPPDTESGIRESPVYDGISWRSATRTAGSRAVDVREKIANYMPKNLNAFEYEYVLLGQAWLQCLDGNVAGGKAELDHLARDLPEGNLVRGTARFLLGKLSAGEELPKRLEFVADE
jgi:hypothetical protein